MDTEMTCYASFAEVTEDFYCSAVDVLKILAVGAVAFVFDWVGCVVFSKVVKLFLK